MQSRKFLFRGGARPDVKSHGFPPMYPKLRQVMNTPHILILGGTGFIGTHVVKRAQAENMHVTTVSLHKQAEKEVCGVRALNVDLVNKSEVERSLVDDYDFVVNLSGYGDHRTFSAGGREIIRSHFDVVQNVVERLSRKRLACFLQIGSADEYGSCPSPHTEDMREAPMSPYSLAKTAATHFLQMMHLTEQFPSVVLRPFSIYGPGQRKAFIPEIIKGCLEDNRFPTSMGEHVRDFCYIDDLVDGIFATMNTSAAIGKVFNVGSGKPARIKDVVLQINQMVGKGSPIFGAIAYRPAESMHQVADLTAISRIVGWHPETSLIEGLNRTIAWYMKRYPILS